MGSRWDRFLARATSLMLVMAVIGGVFVPSASAIDESRTADIVASLPPDIDGTPPQVTMFDGLGWTERLDAAVPEEARAIAEIAAAVGSLGHTLDELSVVAALYALSPGNTVAITAWRLDGVQAVDLAMPVLRVTYGADTELATKVRMVGDSEVIRVRDLTVTGTYPRTLHAVDDVVWIIDAEEPYLERILATLPRSPGDAAPAVLFEPVGDSTWRITEPDRGCRTWSWGETFGSPDGVLWFADDAGVRKLGDCEVARCRRKLDVHGSRCRHGSGRHALGPRRLSPVVVGWRGVGRASRGISTPAGQAPARPNDAATSRSRSRPTGRYGWVARPSRGSMAASGSTTSMARAVGSRSGSTAQSGSLARVSTWFDWANSDAG